MNRIIRLLACLGAGVVAFAAVAAPAGRFFISGGLPESDAGLRALLLAGALEFLWLPLLGAVFLGEKFRGFAETAGALAGATLAGVICSAAYGEAILSFLWLQALVLAVTALALSSGWLVTSLGFGLQWGRQKIFCLTLFLLSTPWWSVFLEEATEGATKTVVMHARVWLSPLACMSVCYEKYNFITLTRMYGIWHGPLAAYPSHPALVVGGYLTLAGLLCAAAYIVKILKSETENIEKE
jgi:hypothetical protein